MMYLNTHEDQTILTVFTQYVWAEEKYQSELSRALRAGSGLGSDASWQDIQQHFFHEHVYRFELPKQTMDVIWIVHDPCHESHVSHFGIDQITEMYKRFIYELYQRGWADHNTKINISQHGYGKHTQARMLGRTEVFDKLISLDIKLTDHIKSELNADFIPFNDAHIKTKMMCDMYLSDFVWDYSGRPLIMFGKAKSPRPEILTDAYNRISNLLYTIPEVSDRDILRWSDFVDADIIENSESDPDLFNPNKPVPWAHGVPSQAGVPCGLDPPEYFYERASVEITSETWVEDPGRLYVTEKLFRGWIAGMPVLGSEYEHTVSQCLGMASFHDILDVDTYDPVDACVEFMLRLSDKDFRYKVQGMINHNIVQSSAIEGQYDTDTIPLKFALGTNKQNPVAPDPEIVMQTREFLGDIDYGTLT